MKYTNDPYGIKEIKRKRQIERERDENKDILLNQIVKELKNIGDKLEKIETTLIQTNE